MEQSSKTVVIHILLLAVAFAVGYGAVRMAYQALSMYRDTVVQKQTIERLRKQKRELEERLVQMAAPGMVEQQAKERLNLKLPGEEVVVVVPDKSEAEEGTEYQADSGFWSRIQAFISGWL